MLFDLHPKENPKSLYARDQDLTNIIQHISNGRWVSILGPRMVGKSINDGTLKNIVDALLSAYIIEKRDKNYHIVDPVIQRYLLSGNRI